EFVVAAPGWPTAPLVSGAAGTPLLRSRTSRFSASNQKGAPNVSAAIVISQPSSTPGNFGLFAFSHPSGRSSWSIDVRASRTACARCLAHAAASAAGPLAPFAAGAHLSPGAGCCAGFEGDEALLPDWAIATAPPDPDAVDPFPPAVAVVVVAVT